jgi:hypothetical protein
MTAKPVPDFEAQSTALWKQRLREQQKDLLRRQEDQRRQRQIVDEMAEWARREIKPTPRGELP